MSILQLGDSLLVNPFYPDHFGGLKVLMDIASIILAIYLLRATMGIVGLLDHKGLKDTFQFLGDLYHTTYLFFGIGFILFFIYRVDSIFDNIDFSQFFSNEQYTRLFMEQFNELHSLNIQDYAGNINNYYGNLVHFNKFPIDLNLFTNSLFTFVLPIALWFLFKFFKNRPQDTQGINQDTP